MGVTETIHHRHYLHDDAIVYISKDGDPLRTTLLGEAFEKLLAIEKISSAIDKILSVALDVELVDELLGSIWKIKELPSSWQDELDSADYEQFEAEYPLQVTADIVFF
jgi:hypothetical protein